MVIGQGANRFVEKGDYIRIVILLAAALTIGAYLIATTVLITQDGVFYIERARGLSSDPVGIIKAHSPGYPFLIFAAHQLFALFGSSSSVYGWIYSAQSVSLLCRLLSLIPLYLLGKMFVGGRKSFWAILILIMLPYPAKFGSDVLRDWPHVLFLATGFLLLLWAAKQGQWWVFGLTGLIAGLGHIVRPECAQLVLYGVLWLTWSFFRPNRGVARSRLVLALAVLVVGFFVPAGPYMSVRGKILPEQVEDLINSFSQLQYDKTQGQNINCSNNICTASSLPETAVKAIIRLAGEICDDLMYYFVLPLVIGVYCYFRRKSSETNVEKFFISVFVIINIIIMIVLYYNRRYISRRHCLPLIVFLIFYVSVGLEILAEWLQSKFSKSRMETKRHPHLYFFVLLVTGIGVCLPKLFRPMRIEKQGYRAVAKWLQENSEQDDAVVVPDKRLSFYAERKGLVYNGEVPERPGYVVRIVRDEHEKQSFYTTAKEEYSVWVDKRKKSGKKLVVYRIM